MDNHSDSDVSSQRHVHSNSVSSLNTQSTDIDDSCEDLQDSDREYIVVVGGLGYIGSHTCLELLKSGYNIVIIDNLSNSFRSVYTRLQTLGNNYFDTRCEPMPQMHLYVSDYRDEAAMKQILGEYVRPHTPHQLLEGEARIESRIRGVQVGV